MQKVTDFLLKYKRYFGAAALLFVFVIVLVSCTGKKGDKLSDTQNATEETNLAGGTQQAADGYEMTGKGKTHSPLRYFAGGGIWTYRFGSDTVFGGAHCGVVYG